jgi:hypothetical protein
VKRRHVTPDDLARLPTLVDLANWTASPWRIGPADSSAEAAGHFDDALGDLENPDGRTTRVFITSYDLDGRNDDQLADWVERCVREALAREDRRAAEAAASLIVTAA